MQYTWCNGLIILLVSLCSFLAAPVQAADPNYLIIIDGGSTSSKLYLFSNAGKLRNPELTLHTKTSKTPPVTDPSFAADPKAYFDGLFTALAAAYPIAEEYRTKIPVYFFATAGLRSLPLEEQERIITLVRDGLTASIHAQGYLAPQDSVKEMRVISGGEEGLFAWLSTQYWNEALEQILLTARKTEAVLEMGGSSTQVAFLPNLKPKEYAHAYQHKVRTYYPYVYSYADYGNEVGMKRMLAYFEQQAGDFAACFPVGMPYPLTNPILYGAGDFKACAAYVREFMYEDKPCKDCTAMGVYQPPMRQQRAILTSGYVYTFNVFGIARKWVTLKDIEQSGQAYCAKPWKDVQAEFPTESPEYLATYCFNGAWMDSLLKGYGLTQQAELLATDTINGVKNSTDWATGAAWSIWLDEL